MGPVKARAVLLKRIAWMKLDLETKTDLSEGVKESIREHIAATKYLLEQAGLWDEDKLTQYSERAREIRADRAERRKVA